MQAQRGTRSWPSPGILKVFWPAFLGWGAAALGLAISESQWFRVSAPEWLSRNLDTLFGFPIWAAPIAALCVTLLYSEARRPVPIVLNFSTVLIVPLIAVLLPRILA